MLSGVGVEVAKVGQRQDLGDDDIAKPMATLRERIENCRQIAVEVHVDDGPHHLANMADLMAWHGAFPWSSYLALTLAAQTASHSASAPEMISISSLVMLA